MAMMRFFIYYSYIRHYLIHVDNLKDIWSLIHAGFSLVHCHFDMDSLSWNIGEEIFAHSFVTIPFLLIPILQDKVLKTSLQNHPWNGHFWHGKYPVSCQHSLYWLKIRIVVILLVIPSCACPGFLGIIRFGCPFLLSLCGLVTSDTYSFRFLADLNQHIYPVTLCCLNTQLIFIILNNHFGYSNQVICHCFPKCGAI